MVDANIKRVRILGNGILKLIVGSAVPASGTSLWFATWLGILGSGNSATSCVGGGVETSGGDYVSGHTTGLAATGESFKPWLSSVKLPVFINGVGTVDCDRGGLAAGKELEVSEEKSLVLQDRPTDGGAILILGEVPAGDAIEIIEIGIGIE